jgi:FMN-dependent NADH-azoreductase
LTAATIEQEEVAMSLLRIDGSIRGELSVSRSVADTAEAAWRRMHPEAKIVRRDLGATPIPGDAWPLAVAAAQSVPEEKRSEAQRAGLALAMELIDEVLAAEAYLFALPLYNYGVPSNVKAWFDMILVDGRVSRDQPLAGRPAALIVARGGGYGKGTPREGWDHATPYYRRVLQDLLGMELHVSEVELTLADVKPEMESLRGLAAESLKAGHESAESHGETLARKILAGAAA